jgi:hypothetical protein
MHDLQEHFPIEEEEGASSQAAAAAYLLSEGKMQVRVSCSCKL